MPVARAGSRFALHDGSLPGRIRSAKSGRASLTAGDCQQADGSPDVPTPLIAARAG